MQKFYIRFIVDNFHKGDDDKRDDAFFLFYSGYNLSRISGTARSTLPLYSVNNRIASSSQKVRP